MTSTPAAYSTDGRTFHFSTDIKSGPEVGGYVHLDVGGGVFLLGQVLDTKINGIGTGSMSVSGIGEIRAMTDGEVILDSKPTPFGSASLSDVDPKLVHAYFARLRGSKAGLDIGRMKRVGDNETATLQAAGFGRHTLVCGQSGSGKTYSLGVVLERLLLETDLRIAVLDPNSDYVNLNEFGGADQMGLDAVEQEKLSERYAEAASRVSIHGTRDDQQPLQTRFGRMPIEQKALVLDLDPLRDAREYNVLGRIVREMPDTEYSLSDVRHKAASMFDDGAQNLAIRIDNLNVEDMSIWAPNEAPAMLDLITEDWRGIVLDLGSLPSANERSLMAASAVHFFWQTRHRRQPTLLVIDEAHNVCPQTPTDRFQAMAVEDLAAIAGEGRKFGLYLLLVTQRPQKLHANVLSQCENILLMRMNSKTDIDHLASVFSHVPESMIRQASSFGLGEGLAAGRISADPMLFKTGTRFSVEGGSDIPATWAEQRKK